MAPNNADACLLTERCLIRVSGEDAMSFLQNLVTNDMTRLVPGQLLYACLLTPQGRFLHDLFISRDNGGFFLECETSRREDLIRRLSIFKLRARVMIEDYSSRANVYVSTSLPMEGACFQDPRLTELGYRFYLPKSTPSFSTVPPDQHHDQRIGLGVPEGSTDIKPEKDLLAHVNLDYLHAVSWDKGCYVGQEITAMTENRGVIKKRMVIVSGKGLIAGDILMHNGHEVGDVRSVNSLRTQGLAVLKLSSLEIPGMIIRRTGESVTARLPEWLHLGVP
ncbi:MAG: folate-binding protein YgfZ [Proteobacteria bacterium]|nr:folate-binding protein YgfZ [Pseudomonadota bacterium]